MMMQPLPTSNNDYADEEEDDGDGCDAGAESSSSSSTRAIFWSNRERIYFTYTYRCVAVVCTLQMFLEKSLVLVFID